MSRAQMTEPALAALADRGAPLDALLVDAALGPLRRLAPKSSTLRFAARLARHPGAIAADTVRVRRHQRGKPTRWLWHRVSLRPGGACWHRGM